MGIPSSTAFKYLSKLIASEILAKEGKPPNVVYKLGPRFQALPFSQAGPAQGGSGGSAPAAVTSWPIQLPSVPQPIVQPSQPATEAPTIAVLGSSVVSIPQDDTKPVLPQPVVPTAGPEQPKAEVNTAGPILQPTQQDTPASNKPPEGDSTGSIPQKVPEKTASRPSSLPSKEELARNSDDFLRRNLSEGGYNLVINILNGGALIGGLWKTKLLVRRWVIAALMLVLAVMGYQWWWAPARQNQFSRTQQELAQAQQQLADRDNEWKAQLAQQQAQAQEQQKNFEAQIKALQSQAQAQEVKKPLPSESSTSSTPVDYDALVQHPLSNASNTINFFKGWLKPKQQINSPPPAGGARGGGSKNNTPPPNLPHQPRLRRGQGGGNEELQSLHQKITQLENQNKQISEQLTQTNEQLKSVMATSEVTKQSNEKEIASQKALVMTQKDQIDQLTQENKRLNEKYLNEETVSANLESQLKAALANSKDASDEQDTSILFDAKGERVK